uniref:LytR/AlgR family response regulator transcription factor n=1 Tax=Actinomadura roseirufa TaxID=2094049 RepID=UPI00104148EC
GQDQDEGGEAERLRELGVVEVDVEGAGLADEEASSEIASPGTTQPKTTPPKTTSPGTALPGPTPTTPTTPPTTSTHATPPPGSGSSGTGSPGTASPGTAGAVGGDVIPAGLGGVIRFVRRADVRYAEAHGDYARLYTPDGTHLVRVSLSALEEAWGDAGFVRIHRSHLVALAHVEEMVLESGRCTLRVGGARLTVSRRNTGALRDRLVRDVRPGTS